MSHPIYKMPPPAEPEENAIIIDWRFQAFTLEIQEVEITNQDLIYGEIFSKCEIINHDKPKGKKKKNATILFALPIAKT